MHCCREIINFGLKQWGLCMGSGLFSFFLLNNTGPLNLSHKDVKLEYSAALYFGEQSVVLGRSTNTSEVLIGVEGK